MGPAKSRDATGRAGYLHVFPFVDTQQFPKPSPRSGS